MASPQGFFVQVGNLESVRIGDSKNWFDEIFKVFGQPDSPNHLETLTITNIGHREARELQ